MAKESVDTSTGEITPVTDEEAATLTKMNRFDDEQLRGIQSYEEAERLLLEEYGADAVDNIDQWLGNGFTVLANEQKSTLVGKPFLILDWSFNKGDVGWFTSARVVTTDGGKFVVNDGSSGIYAQLRDLTDRTRKNTGMRVPRGLRVSQYDTCPSCDRPRRKVDVKCTNILPNESVCGDVSEERHRGETYYLDTSA